ncbi:MAG: glycoside hydrolase family 2 protein, partial [Clostridia bacterium]
MKKIFKAAMGLIFSLGLITAASSWEVKAMSNERETLNFNTGWLYSPCDYSNAQLRQFDDSGFECVSVPHANTVLTAHKGNDFQKQIESYRFVSWYRRHFSLPQEYDGKRIIVEFQGVASAAEVYVNGKYVGSHRGAYTGFSFDITGCIKTDGSDNVIAVRVDSTKRSDIPPEGGSVDYCLFGGIVRDVTMLAVNTLYVENTFISTPELSAGIGTVNSKTTVLNSSAEDKSCSVETVIYDADGREAARGRSEEKTVPAGESLEFEVTTTEIENPHLWDVDDPYLYTSEILIYEDNVLTDRYETRIGMRWFEFRSSETDGNFYLNGKKLKLRGVNRHE